MWADQIGDRSFTFENLLRYFKKSVQFTPPNLQKRGVDGSVTYDPSAFSHSGGPLQVSYSNFWQPSSNSIRRGLLALGLPNILGLNSGNLLGFSEFTVTIDPQASTRSSSETSMLQSSIQNPNIQFYQQTTAQKILFSANKTATGVKVMTAGRSYILSARNEVIVGAGVVSLDPL